MSEENTPQTPKQTNSAKLTESYLESIKYQFDTIGDGKVDYMTDAPYLDYKNGLYLKRQNGFPVDSNFILNELILNTAIRANDYNHTKSVTFDEMKKTKGMSLAEGKTKSNASVFVSAGVFKQDDNGRNVLDAQGKSIPVMNSNGYQKTYLKKVPMWNASQTKGSPIDDKYNYVKPEAKNPNVDFINNKLSELGSQALLTAESNPEEVSKSVFEAVQRVVNANEKYAESSNEETEVIAELTCQTLFKQAKLPFVLSYDDQQIIQKEAFLKFDTKWDPELEPEIDGIKTPSNVLLNCLSASKVIAKSIGPIQQKQTPAKQEATADKQAKQGKKKVVNPSLPF